MQSLSDLRTLAGKTGFDPDYLQAFEAKLFIHRGHRTRRLTNFFVLLLLATVIATFGVISDSTATVIGAMIVAPLMGPIMATAAAVVMGSGQRALWSLGLVALGAAAVILLAALLTTIIPDVAISFDSNSQIVSRISPDLLALLTALASGAAGAFIMGREEIADSMGGVAIAISLVPPLCVVGIAINERQWPAAIGALMLFLTNFLAILLAGGLTFIAMGLGRVAVTGEGQRLRRTSFAIIVAATIVIAVPLTVTSIDVVTHSLENRAAIEDVNAWLDGTTYQMVAADVRAGLVVATIEGYGPRKPLSVLADRLAITLKRPIVVQMRVVPNEVQASGEPGN